MDIDWDNPENLEAVNLDTGETSAVTGMEDALGVDGFWADYDAEWHDSYSRFDRSGASAYNEAVAIRNKWGPPIPVDGKRPEWLEDGVPCNPHWQCGTGDGQWYGHEAPAECVRGWEIVTAIRLKPDHPYYQREAEKAKVAQYIGDCNVKPYMQLGKEAEQPDPADLELRCRALGYANGDLDKAKDIYRFLKGEG